MDDFRNQVAVITGGASGFGRAFALNGAQLGMKLVLADINQDALDAVVGEVQTLGAEVIGLRTDVSQAADIQALADAAIANFGQVNLLFNNAGVAPGGLVWERSEQDWNWALGVNLHGVIHGVRIFTPLMLAAAAKDPAYRGHIINTASVAGLTTAPTLGPYCVAKHAVVALSESLHLDLELVSEQVRCSVLCPGFVATGISRSDRNQPTGDAAQVAPSRAQLAAKAMLDQGTASGTISAEDIAQITFDGIRERRFYLLPHLSSLEAVRQRFDDIINQRNPTGPFAGRPQIRETLMATLRGV